jgi:hypothetical protein
MVAAPMLGGDRRLAWRGLWNASAPFSYERSALSWVERPVRFARIHDLEVLDHPVGLRGLALPADEASAIRGSS